MMRNKCQRAYYKAKDKGRGVSLDVKGSSFGRGINLRSLCKIRAHNWTPSHNQVWDHI